MTTVLIVEDDPTNLLVFSKILTKRGGLEVRSSEDVEEVIRLTSSGEVDVVLMDVSLSQSVYQGKAVDGIQITQMLKANPDTFDIPVILVSAHALPSDQESFLKQSGADAYITKPILDQPKFVEQVKQLALAKKQAR